MALTVRSCGFLLAGLLASVVPAIAGNLDFMKDTPYAHFNQEDHRIFDEALNTMLDKGAEGDARSWANPASNASGRIEVVKTYEREGAACRMLAIANKAKGRSASGEYNFCRKAAGKWELAN